MLFREGTFSESELNYQEALTISKKTKDNERIVAALAGLGDPLRREGKMKEAEAAYREALSLDKDNCTAQQIALYNLLEMLEAQGRLVKEAPVLLDQLPKSASGSRSALMQRWVSALMVKGKFTEAEKIFNEQVSHSSGRELKARH